MNENDLCLILPVCAEGLLIFMFVQFLTVYTLYSRLSGFQISRIRSWVAYD